MVRYNGSLDDEDDSPAPELAPTAPDLSTRPATIIPAPPIPPDADLRGFRKMPLDVVALAGSDFMAESSPVEFKAGLRLWCCAWHQIPAGSLPNSERALAKFAGFEGSQRRWAAVRNGALRGWVLHADGRLYHDFLARIVLDTLSVQNAKRRGAKAVNTGQGADKKRNQQRSSARTSEPQAPAIAPQGSRVEKNPPLSPTGQSAQAGDDSSWSPASPVNLHEIAEELFAAAGKDCDVDVRQCLNRSVFFSPLQAGVPRDQIAQAILWASEYNPPSPPSPSGFVNYCRNVILKRLYDCRRDGAPIHVPKADFEAGTRKVRAKAYFLSLSAGGVWIPREIARRHWDSSTSGAPPGQPGSDISPADIAAGLAEEGYELRGGEVCRLGTLSAKR